MEQENNKLTIGILIICTGRYDIFLQRLIDSLETHFFVGDDIVIYLFWDKPLYCLTLPARFSVVCIPTAHGPWPHSTLYRYKYFIGASHKINSDFLFYIDVDMLLVGDVGREILPGDNDGGLVATGHPGFWAAGGSWCNVTHSKAYTEENRRERYVAGGFQGGETKQYLVACRDMAENISDDESRGFICEWNDEQHWNTYVSTRKYKLLTPEYCMIEETEPREKYGIAHLTPRILALKKNHEELRRF